MNPRAGTLVTERLLMKVTMSTNRCTSENLPLLRQNALLTYTERIADLYRTS